MRLIQKEITITSSSKNFGLEKGASEGSELAVTFIVPDALVSEENRSEFTRAVLEEKERLDRMVLYMEHARGSIDAGNLARRRDILSSGYDRLLKRAPQTPQPVPSNSTPTEELPIEEE